MVRRGCGTGTVIAVCVVIGLKKDKQRMFQVRALTIREEYMYRKRGIAKLKELLRRVQARAQGLVIADMQEDGGDRGEAVRDMA